MAVVGTTDVGKGGAAAGRESDRVEGGAAIEGGVADGGEAARTGDGHESGAAIERAVRQVRPPSGSTPRPSVTMTYQLPNNQRVGVGAPVSAARIEGGRLHECSSLAAQTSDAHADSVMMCESARCSVCRHQTARS